MTDIFLKIVNMSISAGWLVLAVLMLRILLKKAPRWVHVLLWGIVALRLLCPVSIESALSLIPSAETISPDIMTDRTPEIATGIPALNSAINPVIAGSFAPNTGDSVNPLQIWIPVGSAIWAVGAALMLLYMAVSWISLNRKLRTAVRLRENIFQSGRVRAPFVLGLFRPRIYLPGGMEDPHVIAHEKAHIRRKDHWWKPLGFLLLTVHWFNLLMWLAYVLLCRDIELACDEKVIGELGSAQRADYSQALVACSLNRRMISACPLAFGEVGVKERVRSIMSYRKPAFWIVMTAVAVCVVVAVCFLTDPKPAPEFAMKGSKVSDLDPVGIVERIIRYQDIENSNVYMNDKNFTLLVESDFTWSGDQAIHYFYYEDHGTRSAQLRIFPEKGEYFLTEPREWVDQNRIFLLRHYLDALKYLPQEAIRELVPADRYMIEHIDGGSPSDFDRVITYSSEGVGRTDGWYLHLRILPLYRAGSGYSGGEDVVELFYGDSAGNGAQMWYDFSREPELMDWNMEREYTISGFPGETFRCTPYEIAAGDTPLMSGMPVWSAYLSDLSGDGYPEICAEVSFGSGIIDNRILVYDYANGICYTLENRGFHDYFLWRNDSDGLLYADKRIYPDGALLHSGPLVIEDGNLTILGEPDTNPAIVEIVDPTRQEGFSCDAAMEKFFEDDANAYFFSGVYSQYVIVHYEDGISEDIVTALANGRATLADLDRFGIRYWAEPK